MLITEFILFNKNFRDDYNYILEIMKMTFKEIIREDSKFRRLCDSTQVFVHA